MSYQFFVVLAGVVGLAMLIFLVGRDRRDANQSKEALAALVKGISKSSLAEVKEMTFEARRAQQELREELSEGVRRNTEESLQTDSNLANEFINILMKESKAIGQMSFPLRAYAGANAETRETVAYAMTVLRYLRQRELPLTDVLKEVEKKNAEKKNRATRPEDFG